MLWNEGPVTPGNSRENRLPRKTKPLAISGTEKLADDPVSGEPVSPDTPVFPCSFVKSGVFFSFSGAVFG
jgi:hypothetical protein